MKSSFVFKAFVRLLAKESSSCYPFLAALVGLPVELFISRRWRLDRPKQKAVVVMLNPKNYALHARHNEIVVWLLGQSSCSSPSTEELCGRCHCLSVSRRSTFLRSSRIEFLPAKGIKKSHLKSAITDQTSSAFAFGMTRLKSAFRVIFRRSNTYTVQTAKKHFNKVLTLSFKKFTILVDGNFDEKGADKRSLF